VETRKLAKVDLTPDDDEMQGNDEDQDRLRNVSPQPGPSSASRNLDAR